MQYVGAYRFLHIWLNKHIILSIAHSKGVYTEPSF